MVRASISSMAAKRGEGGVMAREPGALGCGSASTVVVEAAVVDVRREKSGGMMALSSGMSEIVEVGIGGRGREDVMLSVGAGNRGLLEVCKGREGSEV